jgi:hypothetical protein
MLQKTTFVDRDRFDTDPGSDPNFHVDADLDPDPTLKFYSCWKIRFFKKLIHTVALPVHNYLFNFVYWYDFVLPFMKTKVFENTAYR